MSKNEENTQLQQAESKFSFLQNEIKRKATETNEKSQNNKAKSFWIYISIAAFSSLITFLVAIGNDVPESYRLGMKIATLIFSGLSTGFAAWDGFYNHKELWVNYGDSRDKLNMLLLRMNLVSDEDKLNPETVEKFYNEYQDILNNGNSKWKKIRVEEKQKN